MKSVQLYAAKAVVESSDRGELDITVDMVEWQVEQIFVALAYLIGRERVADLLENLNAAQ